MMRAFVLVAVFGVVVGAPVKDDSSRVKKSYEAGPYSAPCAGAAPLGPVAVYLSAAPSAPVGSIAHYREDEHNEESEHARSYYGAPAAAAAIAGAGAASTGAVGLFPNAHVGGCAVPLLLSCAPSVHSGHLAATGHGYAAPAASPAYAGLAVSPAYAGPAVSPAYAGPVAYRAESAHGKMAGDKQWNEGKMAGGKMAANNQWNQAKMAPEQQWNQGKMAADQQRNQAKLVPERQWESERAMELLPAEKPEPTRPFAPPQSTGSL